MRRVSAKTFDRIDNGLYDHEAAAWWRPDAFLNQIKFFLNPARIAYAKKTLGGELGLDPPGRSALDVGCGGGLLCEELAGLGFRVAGVDRSRGSVEAARRHAAAGGLDILYSRSTGEALPFRDAAFDAVFCCDVLEHLRDPGPVIGEIARVLKPGGAFLYETINRDWLSAVAIIKFSQDWARWAFMPRRLHVWRMFIRPREMRAELARRGLEWRGHQGLRPGVSLLRALAYMRRRARGDWDYEELGRRMRIVECRGTALMYAGWAVKPGAAPAGPAEGSDG